MTLQLSDQLKFGVQTMHRRTEPATGLWLPDAEDGRAMVEMVDRLGYDSLWVGDHLSFAIPILDPFIQLAQAAAYSSRLELGVGVYLLPLRHPGPVAKQVATLDHLSNGRLTSSGPPILLWSHFSIFPNFLGYGARSISSS